MSVLVIRLVARNAIRALERTPGGVSFGEPTIERPGVTNRRAAYAHPWLDGDREWLGARLPARGQVLDALPEDWRWPASDL
jgi:hypothetical protein